ncbi:MAG: cysteine hydrolase [Comamonadaceae bacterium]|nr:MAG: cysteine hydrolase [Comamonadaceae bacterium]
MSDSLDQSIAPDTAPEGTVLLIIDMVSCWDFPDAEFLLPQAARIAPLIATLKARCRERGMPVIYANDNRGRWRSDFRSLVTESLAGESDGSHITRTLLPGEEDYFVLKPKHSAFFGTPLDLLLQHLEARRVVLTGVSSDQCILATAIAARMRDLDVVVPGDCVASQSTARNNAVLRQFESAMNLPIVPSTQIRLDRFGADAPANQPSARATRDQQKGESSD